MNVKKYMMLIYGIIMSWGGIIAIITIFSLKLDIHISNWFYIITVIIPAIIGIMLSMYCLYNASRQKKEFLHNNLSSINNILDDNITIEKKSINIDAQLGILFNAIPHHNYSNGFVFNGSRCRYFNMNIFNYSNINDVHSAHIELFNALMIQTQKSKTTLCNAYIVKKGFYEFDENKFFLKNKYNIRNLDDLIICCKGSDLKDNGCLRELHNINNLLKGYKWAIYIHRQFVTIIIKSYKIYDFNGNPNKEENIDLAKSILNYDTNLIKHILDSIY